MKNNKSFSSFSIVGFILFSLTIGITSSCSIIVYQLANRATNGNTLIVVICVLSTIVVGAILCCIFDMIRRNKMVDKPTYQILEATKKIASGDFKVKLQPHHEYSKYDEYDLIFENINIMTAELSKNKMLKSDFISNFSHEIKTPLAVMQNYAKLIQNGKISEERKKEYLEGIVIQTQKLSNLVTNILKINKLENQQTLPEKEKFDLAELLRTSILQFESLMEKKQITLNCNIEECSIINTPSLIELVINNLISNAIKFTEKGGKVSITLIDNKKNVSIKVKDTGCGISQEVGKHIFDKFYQGDTSHSSEGNGLGLALVKKIIEVIGGEISVESKVGKGSTFTITLKK